MTEHDVKVAGDIGEMKADVRTLKHDVGNIQQGQIALGARFDAATASLTDKLNSMSNQQSRGVGFFAGMGVVVTAFGGVVFVMFKLLFGGLIAGGRIHP